MAATFDLVVELETFVEPAVAGLLAAPLATGVVGVLVVVVVLVAAGCLLVDWLRDLTWAAERVVGRLADVDVGGSRCSLGKVKLLWFARWAIRWSRLL